MKLTDFFTVNGFSKKLNIQGEVPTTKSAYKYFLKIAWPAMVESFLMSMVNIFDTIMVS